MSKKKFEHKFRKLHFYFGKGGAHMMGDWVHISEEKLKSR